MKGAAVGKAHHLGQLTGRVVPTVDIVDGGVPATLVFELLEGGTLFTQPAVQGGGCHVQALGNILQAR